jgi:hypothetical protein
LEGVDQPAEALDEGGVVGVHGQRDAVQVEPSDVGEPRVVVPPFCFPSFTKAYTL